jgi:hypothetical protein
MLQTIRSEKVANAYTALEQQLQNYDDTIPLTMLNAQTHSDKLMKALVSNSPSRKREIHVNEIISVIKSIYQ